MPDFCDALADERGEGAAVPAVAAAIPATVVPAAAARKSLRDTCESTVMRVSE